jgi:hypothetical protein
VATLTQSAANADSIQQRVIADSTHDAAPAPASVTPPPATSDGAGISGITDRAPNIPDAWPRVRVTSALRRGATRPPVSVDRTGARAAQALAGRLVHRLFQARAAADAPIDALSRHALRLMRGEEQLGLEAPDDIARQAAETFQRVAARDDIRTLLTNGTCLYEVPFSLRLPSSAATPRAEHAMRESGLMSADDGSHLIVRGTIDALVRQPDGAIVVVEFKTGAPHVDHNEQLEMYVEAARAMFPGAEVTGRLIYP